MNGIIVKQLIIDILKDLKKCNEAMEKEPTNYFKKGYSVGSAR